MYVQILEQLNQDIGTLLLEEWLLSMYETLVPSVASHSIGYGDMCQAGKVEAESWEVQGQSSATKAVQKQPRLYKILSQTNSNKNFKKETKSLS